MGMAEVGHLAQSRFGCLILRIGGALAPMLEGLRRIRAAANNSRDLPKVDVGHSVEDFFRKIEETTNRGADLVTWVGELYLEVGCLLSLHA